MNIMRSQLKSRVALAAASLVLVVACFQTPVRAQPVDDLAGWQFAFGFVPGEKARINVAVGGTSNTIAFNEPVTAQLTLFNAVGTEIYKSAAVDVPLIGFATIDVDRQQVADIGDPATHRLQVRGKLVLANGLGDPERDLYALVSVQILDATNGLTDAALPRVYSTQERVDSRSGPINLPRNHRFVFTAHGTSMSGEGSLRFKVQLRAANGRVVAESAETEVSSGHFGTVVIDRSDVGIPCEGSCGAEVHPVWALAIHVKDDPQQRPGVVVTSYEVVDNDTQKTRRLHGELHLTWPGSPL